MSNKTRKRRDQRRRTKERLQWWKDYRHHQATLAFIEWSKQWQQRRLMSFKEELTQS